MADESQSSPTEAEPEHSASARASTPPEDTRPSKKTKTKKTTTSESAARKPKKVQSRFTKLYDAVAGRGGLAGMVPVQTFFSPVIANRPCMRPDEVLFRSRAAPDRLEENDIYFRKRPDDMNILPSSDLLKSIHAYVSFYVEEKLKESGTKDTPLFERLDGAALLAMGVMVEEMVRSIVERENVVGRLVEGDSERGREKSSLDLMEEVRRWQGRKGRGRGDLETWRTGAEERETHEMEGQDEDEDEDAEGETDDEPDAEVDDDDIDLGI